MPKELPESYKKSAEFWNDIWKKTKFQDLPKEVQAELHDYQGMISVWSKLAFNISGGRLSKPNYTLDVYQTAFDEYVEECVKQAVEEEIAALKKQIREELGKVIDKEIETINRFPINKEEDSRDFKQTEKIGKIILSLPILKEEE